MKLTCQKEKFTLDKEICYLNGAYMSPLLKTVEEAGRNGILMKRNPFKTTIDDFFEPLDIARKKFAQLIHTDDADRIALIPSVSYGMANAANNIPISSGDEILIIDEQFPSNYYIWARKAEEKGGKISIAKTTADQNINDRILQLIHAKTKVITIPVVHWADGTIIDIHQITSKAQQYGSYVIVDGTQSIGALDFNINETPVDALIVASYKWLLGPYSYGAAYYGPRFSEGTPIEESWMAKLDSHNFKDLVNYKNTFQPGAKRYDVGEPSNFILIRMFIAALDQLLEWKPSNIQDYCQRLVQAPLAILQDKGYIIAPDDQRANHLFGIRLNDNMDMDTIKQGLADTQIVVSYRGDAIRVSPNIYNTSDDLQKLVSVLLKNT